MSKQIQIKKSSRHIFKLPLESPIKEYNKYSENHQKLARLGKKGESLSKSTIEHIIEKVKLPSKIKIQNILKKELNSLLEEMDNIVRKVLN